MPAIDVILPDELIQAIDRRVASGEFPDRDAFFGAAVVRHAEELDRAPNLAATERVPPADGTP